MRIDSRYWALGLGLLLPAAAGAEGSWEIIANINELHLQVDFLNSKMGISGGTQDGIGARVLKTVDGGHNWYNTFDNPVSLVGLTGASWDGPDRAFCSGVSWILGSKAIQRSDDGGETWDGVWSKSAFAWWTTLQVPEPDVVIAVGYWTRFLVTKYGIAYSSNGGNTWDERLWDYNNYPDTAWPTALDFLNRDEGYIAGGKWPWDSAAAQFGNFDGEGLPAVGYGPGDQGLSTWHAIVEKTTDAGRNWTPLFSQPGWTVTDVDFANRNDGWIVGYYSYTPDQSGPYLGHIFHTSDGGATWEEQTYAESEKTALFCLQMFNRREGWAAGHNDGASQQRSQLYHTLDGGQTWVRSDFHVNCDPRGMDFINESEGWISGFRSSTQGRYLHYYDPAREATLSFVIPQDLMSAVPGQSVGWDLQVKSLSAAPQTTDVWLSVTSPALGALSPYAVMLQPAVTIPGGMESTLHVQVTLPANTPAGLYNFETIAAPFGDQNPLHHLAYADFDLTVQ